MLLVHLSFAQDEIEHEEQSDEGQNEYAETDTAEQCAEEWRHEEYRAERACEGVRCEEGEETRDAHHSHTDQQIG